MKRFVLRVCVFLLGVAALLGMAEGVVRHYPNSYSYKSQWMDAHAGQVKTLVLGGSHNYYAINPEFMGDSTFNLANVSQLPEQDHMLLSHYIDRCVNLKTVIIAIDETNIFDPPMEQGGEWYRSIYYNIYMGCQPASYNPKFNFEFAHWETFNRKLGPALKYLVGKTVPSLECDERGFGCNYHTQDSIDKQVMQDDSRVVVERHRCKDWSVVKGHVDHLREIASMCRNRGIKVIAVTTPMWPGIVDMTSSRQLDTMYRVAWEMVDECGVVYKDYIADQRFQGTDFYDPDHLSRQGAEKFTKNLVSDFGVLLNR